MAFFFQKIFYILNIIFIIYNAPIGSYSIIDFHPMIIKFDFFNIKNKELIDLLRVNFKPVQNYFRELFNIKESLKKKKYFSNLFTKVVCQNKNKYTKFSAINLKDTDLYILPIINEDISTKSKLNNNEYIQGEICKSEDSIPYILLIKVSPLILELNNELKQYELNNYIKWSTIRIILNGLGFNQDALKHYKIENNFKILPNYHMQKFNYYNSLSKYFRFISYQKKKQNISKNKNINAYKNNLMKLPLLNDIMNKKFSLEISLSSSISEITLNIFNDFYYYQINKCDIEYFVNKCYKPNQKCMNKNELNKYFMEYSFINYHTNYSKLNQDDDYFKNDKIICYLNNEKNIKNKQCGINYGHLLSNEEVNKKVCQNYWLQNVSNIHYDIEDINNNINYTISELKLFQKQKISLLNPSSSCPNKNLKTIYFEHPKNKNINKKISIEIIGIRDPKYYVCYSKSIPTESLSNILNENNLIQSYQIWGNHNIHFSNKGLRLQETPKNINFNKYQKVSFFPESNINKDDLYKFYLNLRGKFPSDYNYMPEALINPQDSNKIKELFEDYDFDINNLWVFQRAVNEDGGGVKFFKGYYQLDNARTKNSSFLIKKYIKDPFLINKKKFNFRMYALVTGVNPLRIYLYEEGLILFNTYEYKLNKEQLKNNSVHFLDDNWNNKNKNNSNIWTFSSFINYCKKNGINYMKIINQITDIIIKSFISFNEYIIQKIKKNKFNENNFFEIFSFDFLLDNEGKLFLLKMTGDPKVETNNEIEIDLYNNLIIDALNIVGVIPFSHDKKQKILFDQDEQEEEVNIQGGKINNILCEMNRPMGQFERIFPIKNNINKYEKFFENISNENKLLWKIID